MRPASVRGFKDPSEPCASERSGQRDRPAGVRAPMARGSTLRNRVRQRTTTPPPSRSGSIRNLAQLEAIRPAVEATRILCALPPHRQPIGDPPPILVVTPVAAGWVAQPWLLPGIARALGALPLFPFVARNRPVCQECGDAMRMDSGVPHVI